MDNSSFWDTPELEQLIKNALKEDIGSGDYSSIAVIPVNKTGKAKILLKQDAVVAGLRLAEKIYAIFDSGISVQYFAKDGQWCTKGSILMEVSGSVISILSTERLVLNFCQRLSGIATLSKKYADAAKPFNVKILDTRKTTPGLRILEKWAVRTGGCHNHRTGLYDMIMLKDNHIDFCGGIEKSIRLVQNFQLENNLKLPVEIETRNMKEVEEACATGGINRIMLDNFNPKELQKAVLFINKRFETEASGGITLDNLAVYASTGVDYISVGALTHSPHSVDISLKTAY